MAAISNSEYVILIAFLPQD